MARLIRVHDKYALFQHIPRTGGTWVEQALYKAEVVCSRWIRKQPRRLPRKHALLQHYYRGELDKADIIFTFVRHPLSYYESNWRWMKGFDRNRRALSRMSNPRRNGQQWDWHPQRVPAKHFHKDFDVFVSRILDCEPAWATRLFEWYCGPEGGEFCNFIGRQESLSDDLVDFLEQHMHLAMTEETRWKVTEQKDKNLAQYEEPVEWDPRLKKKVEHSEQSLIRRFYGQTTRERRTYAGVSFRTIATKA